jgi:lipid-A-disaccharide synthase
MRAYVDSLLAVLPFEVDVHRKLGGPPCRYVGHPLLDDLGALRPNSEERARRSAQPPLLLVLPGSRRSEIKRNMAIFGETLRLLREQSVAFEPVLPTVPHLVESVRAAAASWPVQPRIVVGEADKKAAFRSARAALAKSGTVTLELALAGVPMVTAYRVTEFEAFIARRVIQTSSIILAISFSARMSFPNSCSRISRRESRARPARCPRRHADAAAAGGCVCQT